MSPNNSVPVRELVELHVPVVVGGALKLALSGYLESDPTVQRQAAGLSRHHWEHHSARVLQLAERLRVYLV